MSRFSAGFQVCHQDRAGHSIVKQVREVGNTDIFLS